MDIIARAAGDLGISLPENTSLEYSGRFKAYNANVRHSSTAIHFRLSSSWHGVDEEILIGVVQHLLIKVFRLKTSTMNTQLYDEFLKQLSRHTEATRVDAHLKERFDFLNEKYFAGMMDTPNLEWGRRSLQRLGSYHYASDTVRISTVLREQQELLDFVLYHEMLHKKHKFKSSDGSCRHHTKEFREEEAMFYLDDADKKLTAFVNSQRREKPEQKSFLEKLFRRRA